MSFELRFVAPDLRAFDALRSEAMVLPFFEDERPLRGPAGLIDWRLCGALSRLLVRGTMRGAPGERVLVAGRPRLSIDKVVLIGLGARARFDESVFVAAAASMLECMEGLRVRSYVLALPGRNLELVGSGRALEIFLATARSKVEQDEITLIEGLEAQREMGPVLERARRRARALDAAG